MIMLSHNRIKEMKLFFVPGSFVSHVNDYTFYNRCMIYIFFAAKFLS